MEEIKTILIFEILGKPPEHIKKTMEALLDKLGEQKGINIISKKINEPKPLEEDENKKGIRWGVKDLYTTFAEVEIKVDNLDLLFLIITNMLPAHIEILEPETLKLSNFELNSIISNLSIKLHQYDEVAKAITVEKNNLTAQMKELEYKIKELELQNKTMKSEKEEGSEIKTEKEIEEKEKEKSKEKEETEEEGEKTETQESNTDS